MKKLTIILAIILLPSLILGQVIYPDCTNLMVENIQMDNDTANLMKVTISCSNCTSNAVCVYLNLNVIRIVFPFDTIASCICSLTNPDSSSPRVYPINSTVTSIPPLSDIRVSLYFVSCGCDTIPFSPTLGILSNEISNSIHISPNPFVDDISITVNKQNVKQASFFIHNILGQTVFSEQEKNLNSTYKKTIDLNKLSQGIYLLDVNIDGERTVKKIVKK